MVLSGLWSDFVVQVAMPFTSTVCAGQSVLGAPLMVKLTVPEGLIGVTALAVTAAVKVTD